MTFIENRITICAIIGFQKCLHTQNTYKKYSVEFRVGIFIHHFYVCSFIFVYTIFFFELIRKHVLNWMIFIFWLPLIVDCKQIDITKKQKLSIDRFSFTNILKGSHFRFKHISNIKPIQTIFFFFIFLTRFRCFIIA